MVSKNEKFTGNSGRARGERRRGGTKEEKEREREKIISVQLKANRKALIKDTTKTFVRHSEFFTLIYDSKQMLVLRSAGRHGDGHAVVLAKLPCVVFLSLSSFVWLLGRILISGGSGLWLARDAMRAFKYWRRVTCDWNNKIKSQDRFPRREMPKTEH